MRSYEEKIDLHIEKKENRIDMMDKELEQIRITVKHE